jgi:hypothetical protein
MNETTIPQLSDEAKRRIKRIVNYHYGFMPAEEDLLWIDRALRNRYVVLHDQHIIREVVAREIGKDLLKHRDRLGSLEFEKILSDKSVFNYLTLASMCYRAGVSAGAISLCRTAIETGLRERLAEEMAKREATSQNELPVKTLEQLHRLRGESLSNLIVMASREEILSEHDIEESFSVLKFQGQSGRKVLDKFIHGDIVWMVNFVQSRKEDTRVVGAQDILEEGQDRRRYGLDEAVVGGFRQHIGLQPLYL